MYLKSYGTFGTGITEMCEVRVMRCNHEGNVLSRYGRMEGMIIG